VSSYFHATQGKEMSKQLREQRARAHAEGVRAIAENNRSAYDKAMAEVDKLGLEIQKSEARGGVVTRFNVPDPNHSRAFAFAKWLRGGNAAINESERRSIEFRDVVEGD